MKSLPKLLPCPFCGGPAATEHDDNPHSKSWYVGCNNRKEPDCVGFQTETTFAREIDAINAWNRRAPIQLTLEHEDAQQHRKGGN